MELADGNGPELLNHGAVYRLKRRDMPSLYSTVTLFLRSVQGTPLLYVIAIHILRPSDPPSTQRRAAPEMRHPESSSCPTSRVVGCITCDV